MNDKVKNINIIRKERRKLKVLAFGTYDLLHKGHEYHLKKACKYGQLYVVIARDSTVSLMKKKVPVHSEKVRLANIKKLAFVHKVILGNRHGKKQDMYKIVKKINPDVICLGYDQIHFVDGLKQYIDDNKLNAKIVRFRKAHFPEKYKTSILRAKIGKN